MNKSRTWIVVANGSNARILQCMGHNSGVHQLPDSDFHEAIPPARELVTDRPSRVHELVGAMRHAIEPRIDVREQRKERILSALVSHLAQAAERGEFEHLVVVAPAASLGVLRKKFGEPLNRLLRAEVAHDYTRKTNDYIYRRIQEGLPV